MMMRVTEYIILVCGKSRNGLAEGSFLDVWSMDDIRAASI
jgi:hypothetical protein